MPTDQPRAFVLGGALPRRIDRDLVPGAAAIAAVLAVVLVPLRGLYRGTGASMEEGFMLVFPTLVSEGWVPNVDFLHLYGPTSLNLLSVWYEIFGDSLESERTFGLLQHLGIIFAIYALARAHGHLVAVGAAIVATFLVITPIGLSALAWHGGVAFGLWAVVFAVRGRTTEQRSDWLIAGVLAGLALGFRPDLVVALGLALGYATWRRRREGGLVLAGAVLGLIPMWIHLIRAGPVAAIDGMVIDPVARLRDGRELPVPPSWGQVDGALQAVAESLPPWWRLPALPASQQLFFWFWAVIAIAAGVSWWAIRQHRTSDVLAAASLFGLGILPQALQRPVSTHLAWVAMVSWPLLVVVLDRVLRPRLQEWRAPVVATAVVGLLMFVICPFFTYRTYLLQARVSVGDLPVPFEIERDGRRFWVGDPAVKSALDEMMPELDARSNPGDRLFVGPGDLSRTVYADTYIYWLFDELEPATYYIEMDPGLADAEGSGLAEDVESADFVVLTNTWSGWTEPNDSAVSRSQEANEVVADHFCLVESYHTNLVLLFERCEGGGGLNPADVAGRAGGIGGGGVERSP
ncbi:MAG TPA: glycosyltransferase family 39 protein [Acidimicrobiia bacterium]|nr:glycosyltransferase family 39 protein [Acidimicrobiia bacterium]